MDTFDRQPGTVLTLEERAERKRIQQQESIDFAAGEMERLDAMVRRSIALEGA